jgi:hypothetical protein
METYKNSYSVKEDEVLWELHEIRHMLHEELKEKPLAEINRVAREDFESWKCSESCACGSTGNISDVSE